MADAASDEPVHTDHDGVTVEKSYEPDDFPVPAIAFTIRSERDEALSVRLADTVPDDIPSEDIGFHPKYGAEFWDVEGNTIVFTREFEPHEEYVTVYGLRGKDATDVERFLTEPELTSVDPIESASGDVVRDVIDDPDTDRDEGAGEASEPGAADGSEPGAGDASEPGTADAADDGDLDIDLPEPDDGADGTATAGQATADAAAVGAAGTPPAVPEGESVAAALVDEIQAGDVDDETLAELRDALGVTADDSTDTRIEHLQSTVADLDAYTDAIEEFLDEEGDAQSVLRDVRTDFESVSDRLDDVEADVADLRDDVEADVADLRDDVEADVADLRDDVEAVESEIPSATEDRLDDLAADLEALEEELADVAEMRDRLASALGGLGGSATVADDESDADDDAGDEAEGNDVDDASEADADDAEGDDEPDIDLED